MNYSNTAALILAAGESRRMESPKALLLLGEKTLLERSVNLFADAGIRDIQVVIGSHGNIIRSRHSDLPVQWIQNDQFHQGMFSSVVKGIAAISPEHSSFFVLPVDIPMVRSRTISTLLEARHALEINNSILHPTFLGRRGHPPFISTRLIQGILAWSGPGGLGGFLSSHDSDAGEIPVIDEFIGRDMDTQMEYVSMTADFSRYNIPTSAECSAMLTNPSLFSEKTAAHCRQTARLAAFLGKTLAACGVPVDVGKITSGALLHDIAKGEKQHAATGAELLREMGFDGIADIVSTHMDIEVPSSAPPTEAEVVYLADKLVMGDVPVSLAVRFEYKLDKYGHDPSSRAAILKRRTNAEAIVRRMEHAIGKSFQSIMNDFSKDPK